MSMENLLYAIDIDSGVVARNKQAAKDKENEEKKGNNQSLSARGQKAQKESSQKNLMLSDQKPGIVNLRFEECKITRKASILLAEWLK